MLSAVKGVVLAAQGNPEKALELASVMELHKHRFGPQTDFSIQITEILINAERYDAALGIIDRAMARARITTSCWRCPTCCGQRERR